MRLQMDVTNIDMPGLMKLLFYKYYRYAYISLGIKSFYYSSNYISNVNLFLEFVWKCS